MTQKEHFKILFEKLSFEYKNIKLNKIFCAKLMWLAGGNRKAFGTWKTISKFLFCFDVSKFKHSDFKQLLVTFGYYPKRNDHRELMNMVVAKIGSEISYIDTTRWNCHKIKFSILNILTGLFHGIVKMRNVNLSFKDRLLLAAWISFYLNTIDEIEKIDFSKVRKYLSLANCHDLENLLTQYLNLIGKTTYSLMEGVYYIQNSDKPIDDIAFFNLTSNIQLCWGQYSKDEFTKYGFPESRMEVVGYPKLVEGRMMKENNPFKKGVILLSQYTMEKQNLGLIESIYKYADNIDFYLKLHPSLDFDKYKQIAEERRMKIIPKDMTVNECVDNDRFDFAIAINSTAYYEALMRGLPCFRFYDGSYTPLAGCNDNFNNSESFIRQLNRIKDMPSSDFQKEVDEALKYAVGWGIDKYSDILTNSL